MKDGGKHMVTDYRLVNRVNFMRKCPLPWIEQLLVTIKVNSVFSVIDLTMACHYRGIRKEVNPRWFLPYLEWVRAGLFIVHFAFIIPQNGLYYVSQCISLGEQY